jgi:hypothetical protein
VVSAPARRSSTVESAFETGTRGPNPDRTAS